MNEETKLYLFEISSHNKIIKQDLENYNFYDVKNIHFNNKLDISDELGLSFTSFIKIDDVYKIIEENLDENLVKIDLNDEDIGYLKSKENILKMILSFKENVLNNYKLFFNNKEEEYINDIKQYSSFITYDNNDQDIKKFTKDRIKFEYIDEQFIVLEEDKKIYDFMVYFMVNFIYQLSVEIYIDCSNQEILDHNIAHAKRKQELKNKLFSDIIYKQKIINEIIED